MARLHMLTVLPRKLSLDPQSAILVPSRHFSKTLGVWGIGILAKVLQLDEHMSLHADVIQRDTHEDGQVVIHLFHLRHFALGIAWVFYENDFSVGISAS